jgi:hypothetical protein
MPFLGSAIPVLGNDIQVKIRANFWIDGIRQFFSHPLFGVGPDQYGNYYEKYRTITDVQKYPNVLSNDAHSAAVQTLATLGIVGSVLYLVLIAIVIRSLLILWDNRVIERKIVFALALYLAVYLTNSFISPITPSHKYLMWAVCGFIVGRVYINNESKSKITAKFAYAITAVALISCIATFSAAQISYLTAVEDFSRHQDQKSSYQTNPAIPCFMYFDAEFYMLKNNGPQAPLELANEKLKANPRCVAALIAIAQAAANSDDQETLGLYVSQLNEVAPYRSTTLSLSMFYASRTGNKEMAVALQKRMNELGLVYIPGKLG